MDLVLEDKATANTLSVLFAMNEEISRLQGLAYKYHLALSEIAEDTTIHPTTYDDIIEGGGVRVFTRNAKIARQALGVDSYDA